MIEGRATASFFVLARALGVTVEDLLEDEK